MNGNAVGISGHEWSMRETDQPDYTCMNSFSYSQTQSCVSDRARTRLYCLVQLRSWAPQPKLVGFGVHVRMGIEVESKQQWC